MFLIAHNYLFFLLKNPNQTGFKNFIFINAHSTNKVKSPIISELNAPI